MADYYPLIARAIAGLDPSAPGDQRRALYERARTALIAQLRSVEPPLSESEITRERLSLEEAVRKVESEAAARARDLSRGGDGKGRAGDAFRNATPRANARPGDAPNMGNPASSSERSPGGRQPIVPTPRERPAEERAERRPDEPRPPRNLRVDPPPIPKQQQPAIGMQDPTLPPTRERTAARRAENNPPPPNAPGAAAMRGFRDVTADVDDLGRAAAQANRAARKTYANVPSPSPEFDRLEPTMEDRGGDAYGYDEPGDDAAPPEPPRSRKDAKPPKEKKIKPPRLPRTGRRFPLKTAIAIGIVMILVGAAILAAPNIMQAVRGFGSSTPVAVDAPKDNAVAPRPKIADRVGQPSTDQVAAVAQRVVLYDEDPAEPNGKAYNGTVVWSTDRLKPAGGKPGELVVIAKVEIPDRKLKLSISFSRSTEAASSVSHTAMFDFDLPDSFSNGGVANVPGIYMKANEQARGIPLSSQSIKVTANVFLLGLSNVPSDRARNVPLLKGNSWFDIPLVYSNQRRALIAIEKGSPGERAFNEAFAAWGE